MICGIMLYVTLTSLDRVDGSFFNILYIIEVVLLVYLITFRLSLRTNPAWIFRQSKAIKTRFIVMGASIGFLIGWIIYAVITFKT